MLTLFTTAKPFKGRTAIIQRNALKSWTLLHPGAEVILFGDEEGAAEVARELGIVHEPHVERFEGKLPYVDFLFDRAQQIARHDYVCYSNCDIILCKDFLTAFEAARGWRRAFLGVGRRWNIDIEGAVDFTRECWDRDLRALAKSRGRRGGDYWIDYFLFNRSLFDFMPPLIVGHCYWDNWIIWKALSLGVPVVDFSDAALAIHQNHEYTPESERIEGVATDSRSIRNLEAAGGRKHVKSIRAATYRISRDGRVRGNFRRHLPFMPIWLQKVRRFLTFDVWLPLWHFVLDVTRPVRNALRLRSKEIEKPRP